MTYMSNGKIDDGPVQIRATCDKIGNKIGFSKCVIRNINSSQVICEGTHIFAFGPEGTNFFKPKL